MSTFQFKQFIIKQEQSAMKVGTDSILLGSWVAINEADSILDIGAGTGILALMLAQRSNAQTIDAVEIDSDAYEEAVDNFENSPWADRLFCYHTSIQEFVSEIDEKYDLIIANPPYFDISDIKNISKRNLVRQTHLLNHITLLKTARSLLNEKGSCAFVIPYEIESLFIELAEAIHLFPISITRVKDTGNAVYKRSLMQFGYNKSSVSISALILKNKDKSYSKEFIDLTRKFYKNF